MVHQTQHRSIQVLQNLLPFFLISDSIQAIYQQSCKQLLCQVIEWVFINHHHKLFALASLVHNRDKVLCKSEWDVSQRSLKNINQNVGKGAAQFVSTPGDRLFVLSQIADYLIQSNKTVHSLRQVAILKTLDVLRNVVYFFFKNWVQHLPFFSLGLDLVQLLDQF